MSQYKEAMDNHVLEEATQLLRDSRNLEMPPALIVSTVAAIRNRPMPVVRRRTVGGWAPRLSTLAATILLALASVAALWIHGGASVALAQVLDKVKGADSVEFVFVPGQGEAADKQQKCIFQGDKIRIQHSMGIVMISDKKTKQGLYLDPKNKTAGRFTLHEHVATELATDPIVQLQQARTADAERLEKKVVNGKAAEVFRVRGIKLFGVEDDKGEMHVLVDSTTMLPLQIELRVGETSHMTLKGMMWNPVIDPALFSMEIPDGYTEQPAEVFQKLLRPKLDEDKVLTPTEAFRKWQGKSK